MRTAAAAAPRTIIDDESRTPRSAPRVSLSSRDSSVPRSRVPREKVRKIERIEASDGILETRAIYLGSTVTSRFGMLVGGRLSLSHFEVSGAFYRIQTLGRVVRTQPLSHRSVERCFHFHWHAGIRETRNLLSAMMALGRNRFEAVVCFSLVWSKSAFRYFIFSVWHSLQCGFRCCIVKV